MTDNFDFKKFLAENRLGAYSKVGKLNEAVDYRELGDQMKHPDNMDDAPPDEPNLKGKVTQVTPDGTITIELDDPTAKTVVVDSDDFVTKIDGDYYKALYDNHEEGQDIELEPVKSDSSTYLGPGEDENFGLGDKTDYEEPIYEEGSPNPEVDKIVKQLVMKLSGPKYFGHGDHRSTIGALKAGLDRLEAQLP